MDPVKEEAIATAVPSKDAEKAVLEEASSSLEEKERTPSPTLKVDPSESEAMKDLKAKLKLVVVCKYVSRQSNCLVIHIEFLVSFPLLSQVYFISHFLSLSSFSSSFSS